MTRKRVLSFLLALILQLALLPTVLSAAKADTYGEVIMSGKTGDCTYSIVDITTSGKTRYKLIVSGNGKMENYGYTYIDGYRMSPAPWMCFIWFDRIKEVEIRDGVTSISEGLVCTQVMTSSGPYGFDRAGIERVSIAASVTEIHSNAFYGNVNLTDVYYAGTPAQWSAINISSDNTPLTDAAIHNIFITQPASQTVNAGSTASLSVVSGYAESYRWQYSNDGTKWIDCKSAGADTDTFSFTASFGLNGRQYRCVVTHNGNTFASNAAVLMVSEGGVPTVSASPSSKTVALGKSATFKVVSPNARGYQWYYSKNNGASWTKWSGKTSASLTVTGSATNNGCLYRCVLMNNAGSTTSSSARLTVSGVKPTVLTQPAAQAVSAGGKVTFKVVAAGAGLSYQWQYRKDANSAWTNCTSTGSNTASFSFTATAGLNGRQYRCVVKNSVGTTNSSAAKLTVH